MMAHPLRLGIVFLGLLICLVSFQKLSPLVNPAAQAQVVPTGVILATALPVEQRPAPDPVGAQGEYTVSSDQRCVTALNPAGDAETRCADEPMSQATIDWLSRAIEDGRAPGTGVPKG